MTMVDVPRDCVGYVTGARRATLGKIEEEWGTLMFFMSTNMRREDRGGVDSRREFDGSEKLAIFGDRRGRRGAELKCMSAVETKRPGYFTNEVKKHTSDKDGFASDTFPMDESELSYALGKDGTTRRKLARASGCIMEYVGQVAFICGTIDERTRARTYLKWLLKQRSGSVFVDDLDDRDDVTKVPQDHAWEPSPQLHGSHPQLRPEEPYTSPEREPRGRAPRRVTNDSPGAPPPSTNARICGRPI